MLVTILFLTLALAAGSEPAAVSRPTTSPDAASVSGPTISARAQEPPVTPVVIGDTAPDFSFQAYDGKWRTLGALRAQGPVLLLFGASKEQLRAVEAEREKLIDRGVLPVALLEEKPGRAWATARDLGLRYTILSDTRRVIAGQFNALSAGADASVPAWFVIDRAGVVRGLGRGRYPAAGFSAVVARALDLPAPEMAIPTSR